MEEGKPRKRTRKEGQEEEGVERKRKRQEGSSGKEVTAAKKRKKKEGRDDGIKGADRGTQGDGMRETVPAVSGYESKKKNKKKSTKDKLENLEEVESSAAGTRAPLKERFDSITAQSGNINQIPFHADKGLKRSKSTKFTSAIDVTTDTAIGEDKTTTGDSAMGFEGMKSSVVEKVDQKKKKKKKSKKSKEAKDCPNSQRQPETRMDAALSPCDAKLSEKKLTLSSSTVLSQENVAPTPSNTASSLSSAAGPSDSLKLINLNAAPPVSSVTPSAARVTKSNVTSEIVEKRISEKKSCEQSNLAGDNPSIPRVSEHALDESAVFSRSVVGVDVSASSNQLSIIDFDDEDEMLERVLREAVTKQSASDKSTRANCGVAVGSLSSNQKKSSKKKKLSNEVSRAENDWINDARPASAVKQSLLKSNTASTAESHSQPRGSPEDSGIFATGDTQRSTESERDRSDEDSHHFGRGRVSDEVDDDVSGDNPRISRGGQDLVVHDSEQLERDQIYLDHWHAAKGKPDTKIKAFKANARLTMVNNPKVEEIVRLNVDPETVKDMRNPDFDDQPLTTAVWARHNRGVVTPLIRRLNRAHKRGEYLTRKEAMDVADIFLRNRESLGGHPLQLSLTVISKFPFTYEPIVRAAFADKGISMFREDRFTPREDKILSQNFEIFLANHGISSTDKEKLHEILVSPEGKDFRQSSGFLIFAGHRLLRNSDQIYVALKRLYHKYAHKGRFNAEETQSMMEYYEETKKCGIARGHQGDHKKAEGRMKRTNRSIFGKYQVLKKIEAGEEAFKRCDLKLLARVILKLTGVEEICALGHSSAIPWTRVAVEVKQEESMAVFHELSACDMERFWVQSWQRRCCLYEKPRWTWKDFEKLVNEVGRQQTEDRCADEGEIDWKAVLKLFPQALDLKHVRDRWINLRTHCSFYMLKDLFAQVKYLKTVLLPKKLGRQGFVPDDTELVDSSEIEDSEQTEDERGEEESIAEEIKTREDSSNEGEEVEEEEQRERSPDHVVSNLSNQEEEEEVESESERSFERDAVRHEISDDDSSDEEG